MNRRQRYSHTRASELTFDACLVAGVVGSTVGLFFLFLDSVDGQPLKTASMFGSALFLGAQPDRTLAVRYDMVALLSLVNLAGATLIGVTLAILSRALRLGQNAPLTAMLSALTVAGTYLLPAALLMPDVFVVVEPVRAVIATGLSATGVTMALGYGARRARKGERRPAL